MGDMADYYSDRGFEDAPQGDDGMATDFTINDFKINRTVTLDVSELDSMGPGFANSAHGGMRLTVSGSTAERIGPVGTISRVTITGPVAMGKAQVETALYSGTTNCTTMGPRSVSLTVSFASELDALRAAKMFEAHAKRVNKAVAKIADGDLLYYVGSPTVAAGWKKATLEEAVAHAERLAAETGREQTVVEIVRRVKVGTRTRVVTPVKPRRRKPEPTAKSVRAKARGLLRKTTRKKKS